MKLIDPGQKYISHVLSRASCIIRENTYYIKDLRIMQNRSASQIVTVDNMAFSFNSQIENGVYITSFFGSLDDEELKSIKDFLVTIVNVPDVRPIVRKFAGIERLFKLFAKGEIAWPDSDSKEDRGPESDMEGEDIGEFDNFSEAVRKCSS